jgi:hypothetical protein
MACASRAAPVRRHEVHVLPLQTEQLSLSHARVERQHVQCGVVRPGLVGSGNQVPGLLSLLRALRSRASGRAVEGYNNGRFARVYYGDATPVRPPPARRSGRSRFA